MKTARQLYHQERYQKFKATGVCTNHPTVPVAPGKKSCQICLDRSNAKSITVAQVALLPEETQIKCQTKQFGKHIITKDQATNVKQLIDGSYTGACRNCIIIISSIHYATAGGYKPISLPPGEVPWEFFPKVFKDQGNKCAVPWCDRENIRALAGDHSHVTGEFRGFFCAFHNASLMSGIDDLEEHGHSVTLPFPMPATKYYHPQAAVTVNASVVRQIAAHRAAVCPVAPTLDAVPSIPQSFDRATQLPLSA